MKNRLTRESPQTAAGVVLQVASTDFDFLKARLELSLDRCSSERSFVLAALNEPSSDMSDLTGNCARGFNLIGAFGSRPPFNVLRLRIVRSHETTVPKTGND